MHLKELSYTYLLLSFTDFRRIKLHENPFGNFISSVRGSGQVGVAKANESLWCDKFGEVGIVCYLHMQVYLRLYNTEFAIGFVL